MKHWIWTTMALLTLAAAAGAAERPTGRTDGPPGSEYGKGGYAQHRTPGQFYLEGFMGAAQMEVTPKGFDDSTSETNTTAGFNAGYLVEDWLSFQLGYTHILDRIDNLYSGGVRSDYNLEPFNYYFSVESEIYSPEVGKSKFGIVPGIGADVVLSDHLQVGLRYQHDFIIADDDISLNRFSARVQFKF